MFKKICVRINIVLIYFLLFFPNIQSASAGTSDPPSKPVNGSTTLGFNKSVNWSSSKHNGIDYTSKLNNKVISVGKGIVHSYTKNNASCFGSISPNGGGPAIWVKYTLSDGAPVYILYGHTASSWVNNTVLYDKKKLTAFKFKCNYTIKLKSGDIVKANDIIGYTAPFYNGGILQPHLHLSIFKPYCENIKTKKYFQPPSSGWGYSNIKLSTGEFVNPEDFFKSYKLNNK